MYHRHYHQQSHNLASRRMYSQDRQIFLQGQRLAGQTGYVLSSDIKPRLKWTPELHERFLEAVNHVGGVDKATPKAVMRRIGIQGLTLYHLKSHLQKYRLSKPLQAKNGKSLQAKKVVGFLIPVKEVPETNGTVEANKNTMSETIKPIQIKEALQAQIEAQKSLQEQIEVQKRLQLRIEAQVKYLQAVLDKTQETLRKQNFKSAVLQKAKLQLSKLVSKFSNECFSNTYPGSKENPGINYLQVRRTQHVDCSVDSGLTSPEGSRKQQDIHDPNTNLDLCNGNFIHPFTQAGDNKFEQIQPVWYQNLREHKSSTSPTLRTAEKASCSVQPGSNNMHFINPEKEEETVPEFLQSERNDNSFRSEHSVKKPKMQDESVKEENSIGRSCPSMQFDLNADDSEIVLGCNQFDLNEFSWS